MSGYRIRAAFALVAAGLAGWLVSMPAEAYTSCGGKGQRACCVHERTTSNPGACKGSYVERGNCKKDRKDSDCQCGSALGAPIYSDGICKEKDASDPAPPKLPAPVKASACGSDGQRACCVGEGSKDLVLGCGKGTVAKAKCTGDCICGGPDGNQVVLKTPAITHCEKVATCGGKGDKPCTLDVQVTQGRKSCNAGLAEDFIKNQCVEPTNVFTEANCRAVVNLMRTKVVPDFMKPYIAAANNKKGAQSKLDLAAKASAYVEPLKPLVPELQRVYSEAVSAKEIFEPNTLCVPANLQAKLNSLGGKIKPVVKSFLPTYTGTFHMAYTLNASIAAGPGIAAGYVVATDYMGGTGVYVYLGPAVVFNASLGDSIGVQFYPKVTLDSFEGWGFGVGVSGGPPSKIFSGGVDVPMSDKGLPLGIGVSGGIGLGALPVDIGVSATHAWKLWSSK